MKISWQILNSYFNSKLNMTEVLDKLTLSGLEIESVESMVPDFSGVVVAEVIDVIKHPDADKLSICQVNIGDSVTQIVCGASNVAIGVKVPCATLGAILPQDFHITKRKMRGVESSGMLCGASEIGLVDAVDGLHLLPQDAPIGVDIREYLRLNDKIIELKITPNRGDCLSYKGLVREISALLFIPNPWVGVTHNIETKARQSLQINSDLANNFNLLRVKNIDNTIATPAHITDIITASGIASISLTVDLGNYVMMTLGQPMHVYDGKLVTSDKLSLRLSDLDESIELLNDKTIKLKQGIPLVVDENNQALAIAGVMGGKISSVLHSTNEILIEAANFTSKAIAGVARKIATSSDSSYRFERDVDSQIAINAIELFMYELHQICPAAEIVSSASFTNNTQLKVIKFYLSDIIKIIGFNLDIEVILPILSNLGFIANISGEHIDLTVPSYRNDISGKEDIAEEIIRVFGMDNIPLQMPVISSQFVNNKTNYNLEYELKQKAAILGFNEIISYAFITEKDNSLFASQDSVELQNPIAGLRYLRTNLLADLVNVANYNINRGVKELKLFEIATVFHGEDEKEQSTHFAMLLGGTQNHRTWHSAPTEFDFFDIKSYLNQLFLRYNINLIKVSLNNMHPNRSAQIIYRGAKIGIIGQLHPDFKSEIGLNNMPYYLEIDLSKLQDKQSNEYQDISKYQKVSRDISLLVPNEINSGQLIKAIQNLNIIDLVDCWVFDLYSDNKNLSHKSLAISIEFQSKVTTLVEDQINSYIEQLKNMLVTQFSVTLR